VKQLKEEKAAAQEEAVTAQREAEALIEYHNESAEAAHVLEVEKASLVRERNKYMGSSATLKSNYDSAVQAFERTLMKILKNLKEGTTNTVVLI